MQLKIIWVNVNIATRNKEQPDFPILIRSVRHEGITLEITYDPADVYPEET